MNVGSVSLREAKVLKEKEITCKTTKKSDVIMCVHHANTSNSHIFMAA